MKKTILYSSFLMLWDALLLVMTIMDQLIEIMKLKNDSVVKQINAIANNFIIQ